MKRRSWNHRFSKELRRQLQGSCSRHPRLTQSTAEREANYDLLIGAHGACSCSAASTTNKQINISNTIRRSPLQTQRSSANRWRRCGLCSSTSVRTIDVPLCNHVHSRLIELSRSGSLKSRNSRSKIVGFARCTKDARVAMKARRIQ